MRLSFTILLFFFITHLTGQTRMVYTLGGGVNRTFNTSTSKSWGFSGYAGVGLDIGGEASIRFLPSLLYTINDYRTPLEEGYNLGIVQDVASLQLQVSLPVHQQVRCRAGFFTDYIFHNEALTIYRGTIVTTPLIQNYDFADHPPERIQAGILLGGAFPLIASQRLTLDLQIRQNVTSVTQSDYDWTPIGEERRIVFDQKSRPTRLLVGITFTFGEHGL